MSTTLCQWPTSSRQQLDVLFLSIDPTSLLWPLSHKYDMLFYI